MPAHQTALLVKISMKIPVPRVFIFSLCNYPLSLKTCTVTSQRSISATWVVNIERRSFKYITVQVRAGIWGHWEGCSTEMLQAAILISKAGSSASINPDINCCSSAVFCNLREEPLSHHRANWYNIIKILKQR